MPVATDASDRLRLPPSVQERLLAVAHRKTLANGDSLFLKGSAPDALFGVVRGALRVSVVAANGREAVIAMLEAGHWFGEVSLLVGQRLRQALVWIIDVILMPLPVRLAHRLLTIDARAANAGTDSGAQV